MSEDTAKPVEAQYRDDVLDALKDIKRHVYLCFLVLAWSFALSIIGGIVTAIVVYNMWNAVPSSPFGY